LLGKIVPAIGEFWAVILAAISGVTSMLIMAFATAGWSVYLAITVGVLQGIAHPAMNAIMSRQAPPDQQGELQGGIASMLALAAVIGPLVMTQVLGRFSAPDASIHFPGAAFVLAALMSLTSLALIARTWSRLSAAVTSAAHEREAAE
jgi:DHA1 family tetracycline resistance protein-like MFS transporter